MRPSGSLQRSAVPGPSRRRRLTQAGIGGTLGVAAAGGLAAILATSATAGPVAAVAAPSSGSLVDGVAARSHAELVSHTAAQQLAEQRTAFFAAVEAHQRATFFAAVVGQQRDAFFAAVAAQQAAAERPATASRSETRTALPPAGGSLRGEASWYGPGFAGHRTASGEPYDPSGLTAASKTLPLGSHLQICYHGNCVTVRINDRGPYVGSRILDLSDAAAADIGLKSAGVGYVTATPVG